MMLPYENLPKQFFIELVNQVIKLMNSLPKKGRIHRIISPIESSSPERSLRPLPYILVIMPKVIRVGKQLAAMILELKDRLTHYTSVELIMEADILYSNLLSTKQPVSVNRITVISPNADHIKFVDDMADAENQPEGIKFVNINSKVILYDFNEGINDNDDSNASDDDFEHENEYQQEFSKEARMEMSERIATDESQDYESFNNNLRQLVEYPADQVDLQVTRLRPRNADGRATLAHSTAAIETQECNSDKKMKKKKKKRKKKIKFSEKDPIQPPSEEEELHFYDAVTDPLPEEILVPSPDPSLDSGLGISEPTEPDSR
jgi:hypothetical protein